MNQQYEFPYTGPILETSYDDFVRFPCKNHKGISAPFFSGTLALINYKTLAPYQLQDTRYLSIAHTLGTAGADGQSFAR